MSEVIRHSVGLPNHLPPSDAWKVDPLKLEKFFAPTDDRGFVLPEATIEEVLSYFEDDYQWPVDWSKNSPKILQPDDHHFHWQSAKYKPHNFVGRHANVPNKFRDLPTNRGIIPRQFHNVIHKHTLPPEVPSIEDMRAYIQSFELARKLFHSAERALMVDQLYDEISDIVNIDKFTKSYDQLFVSYDDAKYQALGLKALQAIGETDIDVDSLEEVVERLGSCALRNSPNYTVKYFASSSEAA